MEAERNVMDKEISEQFTEQLHRYVRERLIAAEKEILETDVISDAIMKEMRNSACLALRFRRNMVALA